MANPKSNLVAQIRGEIRAAELKAIKNELKGLIEEYNKAKKVVEGIFEKIVEKAEKAEMTAEEVQREFAKDAEAVEAKEE